MGKLFSLSILAVAGGLSHARQDIVVEAEATRTNPFSAPIAVEAICREGDASCLQYEESTGRLYVGGDHSLWVLDASVPTSPRVLGVCRGIGRPRQLCVQDGVAYVAARETGIWIIDVRNASEPKVLTRFDTVELATGIDVCSPVLFCGQRNYGVELIDVTDPRHPRHIKVVKTSESQSVVYNNGILYSGDWGRGEVTTIDCRDASQASVVDVRNLKGYGDGVDVDNGRLYVSTGHHYKDRRRTKEENYGQGHGLEIYDISADPLKPRFVSRVGFPRFYNLGSDFWSPVGCGNTVFCADTFNGLFAVDVTDANAPVVIGRLVARRPSAVRKDLDGKVMDKVPVSDVALGDGVVYFTIPDGGLYCSACVRAKPKKRNRGIVPSNVGYRAEYQSNSRRFATWRPKERAQVQGVAVWGERAYVACSQAGLVMVERNPSGEIVEVGRTDARFAGDVKVHDGCLYVAEGADGVAVYDLRDASRPKELMRCKDFGLSLNCAIWVWPLARDLIAVSNREKGYVFLRVGKDGTLRPFFHSTGCPGWNRYLSDGLIGGRWIAQSKANTGFNWIDISSERPKVIYSKINLGAIFGGNCAFRGDRLLRFSRDGGINYLNPGQPENADGTIWRVDARIMSGNRCVFGQPAWNGADMLAVTHRNLKEIALVDISDEKNPVLLWHETSAGNPEVAVWWDKMLVVPCGYEGLLYSKNGVVK